MKILINNDEEIICKNIEFKSKEVIVTLFDNTIRYFDRVDLVSIKEHNESIEILDGLVSDVGNLLCDVAAECSCDCRNLKINKNMKQTAVEYLEKEFNNYGTLLNCDFINAKEMERQQLKSEHIAKEHFRKQRDEGLLEQSKMYNENEVELIANEMVNWAIDNIGNPNPQSGKKFDEVISKFKNK